jgi:hypothetical protein
LQPYGVEEQHRRLAMREDSMGVVRIQVMEMKVSSASADDTRVLCVMRESLRMEPPVVRFVPQSKRYLGFFH